MTEALAEVSLPDPLREELLAFFTHSSAYIVNQGAPPAHHDRDLLSLSP